MGFFGWLSSMLEKLKPDTIRKVTGGEILVTNGSREAMLAWKNAYIGKPAWIKDSKVKSIRIAASIAEEIARMVTVELESEIVSGSQSPEIPDGRADYLNGIYQRFLSGLRVNTEQACAKGGIVFKPVYDGYQIGIECIQAENYWPLKQSLDGTVTDAVFVDETIVKDKTFYRLEIHKLNGKDRLLTIENRIFEEDIDKGKEVPISKVPKWADLSPITEISTDRPMFSYFRIPLADPKYPSIGLGVSVFARAMEDLEEADNLFSDLLWEYNAGRLKIHADQTAVENISSNAVKDLRDLYVGMDVHAGSMNDLFDVFAPQLRDESFLRGFDTMLKLIETKCGLSYGSISRPDQVSVTATQILTTRQKTYSNVTDIQKSLEAALKDLMKSVDAMTTLYDTAPDGEWKQTFVWDDSIVTDSETQKNFDMMAVQQGILSKEYFLKKWYGATDATMQDFQPRQTSREILEQTLGRINADV